MSFHIFHSHQQTQKFVNPKSTQQFHNKQHFIFSEFLLQLLSFKNTSSSYQWKQIETSLQPKQLIPAEIDDMAHHFSVNNQDLNFSGTHCRDNFNREQLTTLFEAMMQTPYNISNDVGEAATKAIDTFQYAELQANKKSDPYYISKFLLQFQAGQGQFVLPFGSDFQLGEQIRTSRKMTCKG
ncbi:unnamed protein product [Paramecium primaurelia]|uniref:Uncharacterized protein n=1 Tax=Paramecium primaurelia TaxID=5886 RepID=A0A8S1N0H8_PARPR|nr:unnamed protein product [Paramecium primaurelia]